jgi:hypothetical protein
MALNVVYSRLFLHSISLGPCRVVMQEMWFKGIMCDVSQILAKKKKRATTHLMIALEKLRVAF